MEMSGHHCHKAIFDNHDPITAHIETRDFFALWAKQGITTSVKITPDFIKYNRLNKPLRICGTDDHFNESLISTPVHHPSLEDHNPHKLYHLDTDTDD